ncbi:MULTISPECIES: thioredoxin family protein [Bacillus]|uniref:thioredoxin family protein n=1 Tax=Bacillus TaxID=1386 RepID=UPI000BB7F951|nr:MULTISPECIES: thioredoxin family protein [Bacillus]
MKKLFVIVGVIVVIFIALAVITNIQQKKLSEGNPFGKSVIHAETQKQLNDPLYQNIILPDDLEESLETDVTTTIYFYSPTCDACKAASPIIVPAAEEMEVDLKLYNLLEFNQGWDDYNIRATPTVVHFVNGQEVNRVEGYQSREFFDDWFEHIVEEETPAQ